MIVMLTTIFGAMWALLIATSITYAAVSSALTVSTLPGSSSVSVPPTTLSTMFSAQTLPTPPNSSSALQLSTTLSAVSSASTSSATAHRSSVSKTTCHDCQYLTCDGNPFFEVTEENWKASDAGAWNRNRTVHVDKTSPEWLERGSEVNLLVHSFVSIPDGVSCGIGRHGCRDLPTCDKVLQSLNGDEDLARKVWFTIRQIDNLNTVASSVHDQAEQLYGRLAMALPKLTEQFIWKVDPKQAKRCRLVSGLVKTAILTCTIAISAGLSPAAAPAAQTVMVKEASLFSKVPWATLNNIQSNLPILVGGDAIERSVCELFPNPEPGHEEKMHKYVLGVIKAQIDAYLHMIESTMNNLNDGVGLGEDGNFDTTGSTRLAETLLDGDYFKLSDEEERRFIEEPSITAETFQILSMTALLSMERCSLHCTAQPYTDEKAMEPSRFTNDDGTWCQAQCWQNSKHTKNVPLHGLKALNTPNNPWNMTFKDYGRAAYSFWKVFRGSVATTMPSFNDLGSGEDPESRRGSALPVCFSDMTPQNFFEEQNHDKALACVCGDSYGNETTSFFEAIHMDTWSEYKHGTKLADACQTSFDVDRTNPVQMYLTFCQMDQHFPIRDRDQTHHFHPGADPYCQEFEKERQSLTQQGRSLDEVTCHMCFSSATGEKIKKEQSDYFGHRNPSTRDSAGRIEP
ncbi:MAG: hypothetical protein Q9163_003487 [Psora crenata]